MTAGTGQNTGPRAIDPFQTITKLPANNRQTS
jgi:hypothetical protein